MAWPVSLNIGLKEWAVVCDALGKGDQMLLLRKGGIYEAAGEFEVEHRQFLLFPTYLHQNTAMLKEPWRNATSHQSAEPEQVTLALAGVVTDILQLHNRRQMDALEQEHIWTAPLLDMRFNYRPENPLYLLLVRVYRLHPPRTIQNTPAYAGCKSWVPLGFEVPLGQIEPVLDEPTFEQRRKAILRRVE